MVTLAARAGCKSGELAVEINRDSARKQKEVVDRTGDVTVRSFSRSKPTLMVGGFRHWPGAVVL